MPKKKYNDDDGRTIVDMNVDGMPWYVSKRQRKNKEDIQKLHLTKKERRAIVRGVYRAHLPMFLCIAASFTIVMFLIWLWLR